MVSELNHERWLTAVHEAGHAWAYYRYGLPLRYVTLRPRGAATVGMCRPWRPRPVDADANAYIAAAGPIAQAVEQWRSDASDPWREAFDDYLTAAVLWGGGHDDAAHARYYLSDAAMATAVRASLERDWAGVAAVAEQLITVATMPGRQVRALLERHSVHLGHRGHRTGPP